MLGIYSIGLLNRSAKGLEFRCGTCNQLTPMSSYHLPALLSVTEAAKIHICPKCSATSPNSQVVEVAEPTLDNGIAVSG